MRTIAVSSQKGGSGKTTVTGHLAIAAEMFGMGPVGIIDTDPQGSLSDWYEARQISFAKDNSLTLPAFKAVGAAHIARAVDTMRADGIRLVLIDTPPAITRTIETVITQADLVLIPTRPSPHDLRAAGATVDLVEQAQKPLVFVVNAATARARLTGEAAIALSQHGTVAPTILHNRQDFAASMIDGRTTLDAAPNSRSSAEVKHLWDYVGDRLSRLPVRQGFRAVPLTQSRGFGRRGPANGTGFGTGQSTDQPQAV